MPAFTFEKIAPTEHRGSKPSMSQAMPQSLSSSVSPSPGASAPRGTMIQVLGRFVEARVHQVTRADQNPATPKLPK